MINTQMNSQRLWQHIQDLHRLKPDVIPALNGGTGYKVPRPHQEVIYKSELQLKRLSVFSNGVSISISMVPQGKQAPHPGVAD